MSHSYLHLKHKTHHHHCTDLMYIVAFQSIRWPIEVFVLPMANHLRPHKCLSHCRLTHRSMKYPIPSLRWLCQNCDQSIHFRRLCCLKI